MRKLVKATAALLLGSSFSLSASGPTGRDGDFPAPSTISPEARAALARFRLATRNMAQPKPEDTAGWRKVQADAETRYAEANAAVVRQYQPRIEERTLGGVPVLDIRPKGWKGDRRMLVYTHGGAYAMYSARSRLISAVPMANDTGLRV